MIARQIDASLPHPLPLALLRQRANLIDPMRHQVLGQKDWGARSYILLLVTKGKKNML